MKNIIKILDKIDCLLPRKYFYFLTAYFLVVLVGFYIPVGLIQKIFHLDPFSENPVPAANPIIVSVIIGPIIETLIFQYLLIKGLYLLIEGTALTKETFSKNTLLYVILISALIFGGCHYFSLMYVVLMCYLGLLFNLVFYFSILRKWHPFVPMFLLHSFYNLTVFLLKDVF